MKEKTKKIGAPLIGLALLGAGVGGGFILDNPDTIVEEKIINETITVVKEVPMEVPVEVIKEVPVDNGNLDLVLDHVYDNNGDVEYLTDDLDDDEVQQIVDRIVFIDDVKKLAVDYVKDEGIDELDKEVVNGTELDEDDVERFKIDDDSDDIIIDDVDFEYGEAEVLVEARFEHDDVDYEVVYRVEFDEGEADDISIESINER